MTRSTDSARRAAGFLGIDQTAELGGQGVTVFDPCSTLISPGIVLEAGIVLWPGTVLHAAVGARISIGANTIFYPGARIAAAAGRITVGGSAEIGDECGFVLRTDTAVHEVVIGDGARLLGGGSLFGSCHIGSGAQILGPIRVQNCRLEDGGSYLEPDPERRGGVLKGCGSARDLIVPRGKVIQAFGLFAEAPLRRQTDFTHRRRVLLRAIANGPTRKDEYSGTERSSL